MYISIYPLWASPTRLSTLPPFLKPKLSYVQLFYNISQYSENCTRSNQIRFLKKSVMYWGSKRRIYIYIYIIVNIFFILHLNRARIQTCMSGVHFHVKFKTIKVHFFKFFSSSIFLLCFVLLSPRNGGNEEFQIKSKKKKKTIHVLYISTLMCVRSANTQTFLPSVVLKSLQKLFKFKHLCCFLLLSTFP